MKKAQVGIEFIFIIGVTLLLFVIMLGIYYSEKGKINDVNNYLEKRNLCLTLSSLITEVFVNNDVEITLASDYNVNFRNKIIDVDGVICSNKINISSNVNKGALKISKKNNVILIENV